MTVLPQLTSRIGHPSEAVFGILKQMFVKLLTHYPQQTLWQMVRHREQQQEEEEEEEDK